MTNRVLVLTPTFGRSQTLLQNIIWCFQQQTYEDKHLLLYDDGRKSVNPLIPEVQVGSNWTYVADYSRNESLPAKYHHMITTLSPSYIPLWDSIVLMDDDDVYLDQYIQNHVSAMGDGGWSHPSKVWSTYPRPGRPILEGADGRFHGSLAMSKEIYSAVNGWKQDLRADFDQDIIARCKEIQAPGDPCQYNIPQYVFRWQDSGGHHCQSLMSSPSNEDWYERTATSRDEYCQATIGTLTPEPDRSTQSILNWFTANPTAGH